jgi:hypothetical protein
MKIMEVKMSELDNEKTVESMMTEDDFAIDSVGRILIINNKKILEIISGGIRSGLLGDQFLFNPPEGAKLDLLDNQFLHDQLGNNCSCTGSGSGSGSGTGSGSCPSLGSCPSYCPVYLGY